MKTILFIAIMAFGFVGQFSKAEMTQAQKDAVVQEILNGNYSVLDSLEVTPDRGGGGCYQYCEEQYQQCLQQRGDTTGVCAALQAVCTTKCGQK